MKNIQVIDDAVNCTYDIFQIDEDSFLEIFPNGQDIEFETDLFDRLDESKVQEIFARLWANRIDKKVVSGIHGTLFFGYHCEDKRPFYPTKKEAEMIANP